MPRERRTHAKYIIFCGSNNQGNMEQVNLIIDTYQRIILESESKLAKVKQHIYRIGTLRLILFWQELQVSFISGTRVGW